MNVDVSEQQFPIPNDNLKEVFLFRSQQYTQVGPRFVLLRFLGVVIVTP